MPPSFLSKGQMLAPTKALLLLPALKALYDPGAIFVSHWLKKRILMNYVRRAGLLSEASNSPSTTSNESGEGQTTITADLVEGLFDRAFGVQMGLPYRPPHSAHHGTADARRIRQGRNARRRLQQQRGEAQRDQGPGRREAGIPSTTDTAPAASASSIVMPPPPLTQAPNGGGDSVGVARAAGSEGTASVARSGTGIRAPNAGPTPASRPPVSYNTMRTGGLLAPAGQFLVNATRMHPYTPYASRLPASAAATQPSASGSPAVVAVPTPSPTAQPTGTASATTDVEPARDAPAAESSARHDSGSDWQSTDSHSTESEVTGSSSEEDASDRARAVRVFLVSVLSLMLISPAFTQTLWR